MGLFSIFKKKKKDSIEEENVTGKVTSLIPEPERPYRDNPCEICKSPLGIERWTKQSGFYFHRSCFNQNKNLAKKEGKI